MLLAIGYGARALGHTDHAAGSSIGTSTATSTSAGAPVGTGASTSGGVALSVLPAEARTTVSLIQRGGPYPYSRDGVVFNNAERRLPVQPRGYYHEYTVTTPGSADRGTRRIITGRSGEFYYTGDHYNSFRRIDLTG